jgi:osmotically inducible lipoprotein OsmB
MFLLFICFKEKVMRKILIITCIMAVLTGCVSPGHVTRRDVGTVVGGVGGGIIGNQLTGGSAVGTIAGTLGGAYVGNQLAR